MKIEETKIVNNKLILPKQLLKILKWKYPFYKIPNLNEYNQRIIAFSKENNQLPFYSKLDINDDGKEEIILVQKSIIGGYGRLLIISTKNDKVQIEKIKWKRPVNSLFFDYFIDAAKPNKYQKTGIRGLKDNEILKDYKEAKRVIVKYPHIRTKGYLTRIIYWDGLSYCQEKISNLDELDKIE